MKMEHPELLQAYRSNRNRVNAGYVIACVIFAALIVMIAASTAHAETYKELQERYGAVEVGVAPPGTEIVENPYQTIPISESEYEELRWILALEGGNLVGFKGEVAICEVIFNRVLSQKSNWGGSVHGVLSKRGQFSTYHLIGSRDAWNTPGELEDDAISECLRRGPSVLPSMSYVYFDRKGVNGKNKIRMGRHSFGAE